MEKGIFKIFIYLGKVFTILFSFLLIALVLLAVKSKSEDIVLPCTNSNTPLISKKEEYVDMNITSTCELIYIEIKVEETIDKEKMQVLMLDLTFELTNFNNVEVLIYNTNNRLFGKLLGKGEIIIN